MKVIKKGKPTEPWSPQELECEGSYNSTGCGAILLVDEDDLFERILPHPNECDERVMSFRCPECGGTTDATNSDTVKRKANGTVHIQAGTEDWEPDENEMNSLVGIFLSAKQDKAKQYHVWPSPGFASRLKGYKYTSWACKLDEEALCALLWAVGEYGCRVGPDFKAPGYHARAQAGLRMIFDIYKGRVKTVDAVTAAMRMAHNHE